MSASELSTRDAWLAQRRGGIGGSDAAVICGVSKWRTPYELWAEKSGLSDGGVEDNIDMLIGRALEPEIRQRYADQTGRVVAVPDGIQRHPAHHWMIGSLDGVTDDGRVLEIKTARSGPEWGAPGSADIPQTYLLQVQHYLAVTGLPVADVAVMFKDRRVPAVDVYEIPADLELQVMLIEAEAEFWRAVVEGTPPAPVSYADMLARYGRESTEGSVVATEDVERAVATLRDIAKQRKALDASEEEARTLVMAALGERDTLLSGLTGKALVTWRAQAGAKRFDAAAFRDSHPELHAQFLRTGEPSRRFVLK